MHSVTVRHNFETSHRLPQLGGKCVSLHGHSWWVEVTASCADLTPAGTVVEFGSFKGQLRQEIDTYLDHGTMLGANDPLLSALQAEECKVLVFGAATPRNYMEEFGVDLPWPTVENVASLLARLASRILQRIADEGQAGSKAFSPPSVSRVHITETHVNSATWSPS